MNANQKIILNLLLIFKLGFHTVFITVHVEIHKAEEN